MFPLENKWFGVNSETTIRQVQNKALVKIGGAVVGDADFLNSCGSMTILASRLKISVETWERKPQQALLVCVASTAGIVFAPGGGCGGGWIRFKARFRLLATTPSVVASSLNYAGALSCSLCILTPSQSVLVLTHCILSAGPTRQEFCIIKQMSCCHQSVGHLLSYSYPLSIR